MKPLCIVQARMGSTRLPGKVMMEVKGKPLLGYLLERLERCDPIVACPQRDLDTFGGKHDWYLIDKDIRLHGYGYYGDRPEYLAMDNDVAGRFAEVLRCENCCPDGAPDTFIRICADSPLLDPALVDAAVTLYQPPYLQIRSPVGSVEVCDTEYFLFNLPNMTPEEREHVTACLATDSDIITIPTLVGHRLHEQRLVVDTAEDFERVKSVIEKMAGDHRSYGWRECLALL